VYMPRTSLYRRLAMSTALLALGNPLAAATSAAAPLPSRGYFAKDNGPVYVLTHRNLGLALHDNPSALALEARAHRYEVANTVSSVLGMGLFIGGLVRSINHLGGIHQNENLTLGMLGASVPLLVVPLVLQGKPTHYRQQAIALYNYAQQ
jgi:hypothetical protein